jgi:hypothetical protein
VGSVDAQCNVGFFNTFLIKGADIYFGHKDKVYVISKQLIVDVFGICAKGYVEEPKGQVSQPHFEKSVRMKFTFPKWELGSPLGLPKL